MIKTNKKSIMLAIMLVLIMMTIVASQVFIFADLNVACAEEDEKDYVCFYINEDELYTKIEIINGKFTIPEENPTQDGYTFKGWLDGFAYLSEGVEYTATSSDMEIYATWEEIPDNITYTTPVWKIVLISLIVILLLGTFLFFYYWCGMREIKANKIFATIKAERAEKKQKRLNK